MILNNTDSWKRYAICAIYSSAPWAATVEIKLERPRKLDTSLMDTAHSKLEYLHKRINQPLLLRQQGQMICTKWLHPSAFACVGLDGSRTGKVESRRAPESFYMVLVYWLRAKSNIRFNICHCAQFHALLASKLVQIFVCVREIVFNRIRRFCNRVEWTAKAYGCITLQTSTYELSYEAH